MAQNKIIFKDLSLKKIDVALEKLVENRVLVDAGFGETRAVPIYFRTRDSKMIPDDTDTGGGIYFSFSESQRADAAYRVQGDFCQVISKDKDGNPLKFRVRANPEPHWFTYTVVARSGNLNDSRMLQTELDKIFPAFHRTLMVDGFKTKLFRDSNSNFDLDDLGIFISEWTIRVLGYLYTDEAKAKIVHAVKKALVSFAVTTDPKAPDEIFEVIEVC